MRWGRKSEAGEMYCAVHNADCDLHSHSGDPWVLIINPGKIPTSWMCPEAVKEIENFGVDAEEKMEENDTEPVGLVMDDSDEDIIREAIELGEYSSASDDIHTKIHRRGVESLTAPEIDFCITRLEEHQDELPDKAERIASQLIDAWEESVGTEYK